MPDPAPPRPPWPRSALTQRLLHRGRVAVQHLGAHLLGARPLLPRLLLLPRRIRQVPARQVGAQPVPGGQLRHAGRPRRAAGLQVLWQLRLRRKQVAHGRQRGVWGASAAVRLRRADGVCQDGRVLQPLLLVGRQDGGLRGTAGAAGGSALPSGGERAEQLGAAALDQKQPGSKGAGCCVPCKSIAATTSPPFSVLPHAPHLAKHGVGAG